MQHLAALESYYTEQACDLNEEMINILISSSNFGGCVTVFIRWLNRWFPQCPHAWPKNTLKDPTFFLSRNKAIPS